METNNYDSISKVMKLIQTLAKNNIEIIKNNTDYASSLFKNELEKEHDQQIFNNLIHQNAELVKINNQFSEMHKKLLDLYMNHVKPLSNKVEPGKNQTEHKLTPVNTSVFIDTFFVDEKYEQAPVRVNRVLRHMLAFNLVENVANQDKEPLL